LENLIVSTCLIRGIRGRAIRDYRIGEDKNLPYIFNIPPTNLHSNITFKVGDYE
jgi:hypothetical protein